jgi:hypothetical protein
MQWTASRSALSFPALKRPGLSRNLVIEFNGLHGRVVDIDMFATTLVEFDKSGQ